ncbi:MAG TPA: MBL fold metallo-hydrolase, partial [Candidatus Altiarchaeales archaeon]|nr:MBL fold metallo-hydrolase [Candidatus Altiarchaeales archaeon]
MGKSCIQVKTEGLSLLFDAGVKIGDHPPLYPQDPGRIDAIFLSHAHLDHCGSVPMYNSRQNFPIYLTEPTSDLSHMIQADSLKIDLLNDYEIRYTEKDIKRLGKSEIPVSYGREMAF